MAEPPPTAGGSQPPTCPQPTQTNGNTTEPTGPVAGPSPIVKLASRIATGVTTYFSPPRNINLSEPQSEPSGITATTDNTPPAAASKRPAVPDSDEESITSPKKPKYADFTTKKSDDNSLMSADDENKWEKEDNEMIQLVRDDVVAEDKIAAEMCDDAVENNVTFDVLEEGQVNPGAGVQNEPTERTFKWKRYNCEVKTGHEQYITDKDLKDLLRKLSLAVSGAKKRDRFNRLRDCGKEEFVKKIDDDTIDFKVYDDEEATLPKWIILTGVEVPAKEGIDMETGATENFYNPTNPDEAKIAKNRRDFLTRPEERIKRPAFAAKPKKKKKKSNSATVPPVQTPPPPPPPFNGGPTEQAKKEIGDIRTARPKDFFYTQITKEFVKRQMVDTTNARAVAEGEGSKTEYIPFDVEEMERFIGLMMANGVVPRPQMEHWFMDCWLRGNQKMKDAMEKKVGNRTVSGLDRWRLMRRLMCFYDHRQDLRKAKEQNPLFKVQPLLDELNYQARKMWRTGKFVSIDEQTLGFKGKSSLKLRISYKREGDGFQCDALCDRGYTFSFYFRHGDAPDVGHTDLELSPTARRVVWLAKRMPNKWACVFMDNLFNSRKLFAALYRESVLAHGVARTNGRGIPQDIIIPREPNEQKANAIRGTTKAAKLINQKDCPDLLSVAIMDVQPVHMLSTVAETIEWGVKERERVWSITDQELQTMKFLRHEFIEMYNKFMNSTDIADQLRNNYRPDHWMRQRKWWWAFFIWGIGVAATNAWLIYDAMYKEELEKIKKNKAKKTLPKKWNHLDFIIELINDLIFPDDYKSKKEYLRTVVASGTASTSTSSTLRSGTSISSSRSTSSVDLTDANTTKDYIKKNTASSITEARLKNSFFYVRFDGKRHASIPGVPRETSCQLCHYKWKQLDEYGKNNEKNKKMKQNRDQVRRCLVCNVNLCCLCDNEWHGVDLSAYTVSD